MLTIKQAATYLDLDMMRGRLEVITDNDLANEELNDLTDEQRATFIKIAVTKEQP